MLQVLASRLPAPLGKLGTASTSDAPMQRKVHTIPSQKVPIPAITKEIPQLRVSRISAMKSSIDMVQVCAATAPSVSSLAICAGLSAVRRRQRMLVSRACLAERMQGDLRSDAVDIKATNGIAAVKQNRPSPKVQLFTREDPDRIHAVLGFACLLHILVRLSLLVSGVPDMGFRADALTLACLGLHVMLACSSFQFRVPKKEAKKEHRVGRNIEPTIRFSLYARFVRCCVLGLRRTLAWTSFGMFG
eukprot:TRINITY_DN32039_c0_g1_i1.p1 TRINITY_DN32039_c0_g1~~TRINITY_DN32039_c0_g1_i1.p1  ORF type:complete len:246 (-),score=28.98 TRINITY_DN32039_c0_g1_i1:515-1252(-)